MTDITAPRPPILRGVHDPRARRLGHTGPRDDRIMIQCSRNNTFFETAQGRRRKAWTRTSTVIHTDPSPSPQARKHFDTRATSCSTRQMNPRTPVPHSSVLANALIIAWLFCAVQYLDNPWRADVNEAGSHPVPTPPHHASNVFTCPSLDKG